MLAVNDFSIVLTKVVTKTGLLYHVLFLYLLSSKATKQTFHSSSQFVI